MGQTCRSGNLPCDNPYCIWGSPKQQILYTSVRLACQESWKQTGEFWKTNYLPFGVKRRGISADTFCVVLPVNNNMEPKRRLQERGLGDWSSPYSSLHIVWSLVCLSLQFGGSLLISVGDMHCRSWSAALCLGRSSQCPCWCAAWGDKSYVAGSLCLHFFSASCESRRAYLRIQVACLEKCRKVRVVLNSSKAAT